ncbi:hypothetical protein CPB84DRAFT_1816923 [Gymnopilus junonius]|uniref:CCAAT-binding factor domain-containing protein n=1 Tax=Gymnopilus junonius TaxID=109634 RepID=A0A9P5NI87_GYMJU|nr:hypothetical protein CPB84DRAFT_1816923 [Gymnopilus junonius]
MAPSLHSLPPPSKKRKTSKEDYSSRIKQLEEELTDAAAKNTSLNPLADLLALAYDAEDPHDTSKAIYALYRVFVIIISNNKTDISGDEAAKVVKAWIWDRLQVYVDFLGSLLQDNEKFLRTSALQILFSLQKHLSTSSTRSSHPTKPRPQFHTSHFRKIVSSLLLCPRSQRHSSTPKQDGALIDPDVLNLFYDTWFSVHGDIRWFFLRDSAYDAIKYPLTYRLSNLPVNLLSILERMSTFPTEQSELNAWWAPTDGDSSEDEEENVKAGDEDDDWRKFFDEPAKTADGKTKSSSARLHQLTIHQSLHSLPSHKAVFTRAWLTLLPCLSTNGSVEKNTTRALNLMHRGVLPHLTRPILVMDWIGACAGPCLLALNALFMLMKEYNLHLPAALLASFVKKLSRLSLTAPPAAIVMTPALMVMIHRADVDDSNDSFLPDERNPVETHAIDSSLWELLSHTSHYHAPVSTMCKIFSEPFTKPGYAMEDFLDHTYNTLFETEVNRKIKREPALAMESSVNVFAQSREQDGSEDLSSVVGTQRDFINELWAFA